MILEVKDIGDDEDSTKLLIKKLDATERDVHAFGKNVEKLSDIAESMRAQNHFDSLNITRRLEALKDHHRELNNLIRFRRQDLQDGQKLFGFYEDCSSLMATLREKLAVADSEDYGTDVEHVDMLLQKFANFQKGLSIMQIRVKNVNDKAQSLANEGHPQVQQIKMKTAEVNDLWRKLQESAKTRQAALQGAREVHILVRDCDETIGWIQERDAAVSSEDYGQDLESVQSLIRRHEGFQRDLAPFGQRVSQLHQEAANLITRFPDAGVHIQRKDDEMQNSWKDLLDKSAIRKERLHLAESLQSYLNKYREFSLWISEMLAVITSYDLPQDVRRAEALLRRHKEHKAEIDSRLDEYNQIRKEGMLVVQRKHFMAEEIRDKLNKLEIGYDQLCEIWKKRNEIYSLNLDVQIFIRDCNMLTSWMQTQDPFLKEKSFMHKDTPIHAVEEHIRKHDDFAKTVENQEDRLNLVKRLTELEKAFNMQLAREAEVKSGDRLRQEADRLAQLQRENMAKNNAKTTPDAARKTSVGRISSFTSSSMRKKGGAQSPESAATSPKAGTSAKVPIKIFQKPKFGDALPAVDMEGMLDRKQELDAGGHKSSSRSWKTFHTVLCGQLLCFFKKRQTSYDKGAASSPLNLHDCTVFQAFDYKKKDFVFRLKLKDGSEYLFAADDDAKMREWIDKIQFHAALPPTLQLISYKDGQQEARKILSDGNENGEGALRYAQTLSRNTPSPMSNGTSNGDRYPVPITTRRYDTASPESVSSNGNGYGYSGSTEGISGVPEMHSGESSGPTVPSRPSFREKVGRSESFGGDADNGYEEREVDVVDLRDRAQTSIGIVDDQYSRNRGVTLPVGAKLDQAAADMARKPPGASGDKRGSKTSIMGIFRRKGHDKEKI